MKIEVNCPVGKDNCPFWKPKKITQNGEISWSCKSEEICNSVIKAMKELTIKRKGEE